ncbi:translation initiation factor IF-2-like [Panthera leo]|uniref:translation initiation factor IF-2-like n=1 Tax=Panthera leo TaxID=9689 RepID=UPI001C6A336A|nr:translation initiation factor IF-2-like [Panthera leo]
MKTAGIPEVCDLRLSTETGSRSLAYSPPPRTAHLPGSSRSKETGHLRPRAPGLRLKPAVAAGPKGGVPRRAECPRPRNPWVLRLAGPGQAGRGRLTRSPGRSAGWAEAFAAPLLHECAPGSNRVGARRGHSTPDRGAVTCKSGQLLPPSIPPRGLADGASRPRPALPRPFRQRRRGESGPGGAHGSGGGGAATPAGGRSSADCAENRPGRVEPRRQRRVFIFTWPEKRAYLNVVSLDFLRSQTPLNIFERYNVVSRKMSLACRASIQMEAHSKRLSI